MISYRKEENLRIISSFRKYKRLGLASQKLTPFDIYDRIRGVCKSNDDALDLLAVYDTIRLLKLSEKLDVLDSLNEIYFSSANKYTSKAKISAKVIRHAYESNCDERTVYRRLAYARKLYRQIRNNY